MGLEGPWGYRVGSAGRGLGCGGPVLTLGAQAQESRQTCPLHPGPSWQRGTARATSPISLPSEKAASGPKGNHGVQRGGLGLHLAAILQVWLWDQGGQVWSRCACGACRGRSAGEHLTGNRVSPSVCGHRAARLGPRPVQSGPQPQGYQGQPCRDRLSKASCMPAPPAPDCPWGPPAAAAARPGGDRLCPKPRAGSG